MVRHGGFSGKRTVLLPFYIRGHPLFLIQTNLKITLFLALLGRNFTLFKISLNKKSGMNVAEMRSGETRTIRSIDDDQLMLKLLEMGCIPGQPITFKYKAPLGDPVCVTVSGYDLSLRISEASSISVQ